MIDRLIAFDAARLVGDLSLTEDGTIATTDGLGSAVLISLFTDRQARADDDIPDRTDDRRGWCLTHRLREMDAGADELGSRLWLLSREKQLAVVVRRAKEYAEEALAWLITRKLAAAVTVTAEVTAPGILGLLVEVTRRDGTRWTGTYDYYWGGRRGD